MREIGAAEEEAISMLVAGKLEAMGMEVSKHSAQPHRPNVLGVLRGQKGSPSLILNDHLDTYPVVEPEKWHMTDFDPFKATRHGDLLFARGTSDTRGNLAASLLAVQALVEAGVKLEGTLICCYTVDEERNGAEGPDGDRVGQRIGRLHPVQQGRQDARRGQRARDAACETGAGELHAPADDQGQDVADEGVSGRCRSRWGFGRRRVRRGW